jgi:hypothetical protein
MYYTTSVVAAAGPTDSTPLGGPPLTSYSTLVVTAIEPTGSNPQRAHHQRLLKLG